VPDDDDDCVYGVDELAERGGVSRRTVRYYIQRGLLPPPRGLGRGKHYTEAHVSTLVRIRELQEAAVPLEAIAAQLDPRAAQQPALEREPLPPSGAEPTQTSWTRVVLGPDVELHVRGRRLTEEQLRKLALAVTRAIGGMST
jgi:DNA-binding transcriptional MerR regulator